MYQHDHTFSEVKGFLSHLGMRLNDLMLTPLLQNGSKFSYLLSMNLTTRQAQDTFKMIFFNGAREFLCLHW